MCEDVLSMSTVDYQEFNIFKSFSYRNGATGEKKSFTLKDFAYLKATVQGELRGAVIDKSKISLKLWLRVKNIES